MIAAGLVGADGAAPARNGSAANRFDLVAACATLSKCAPARPEIAKGRRSWLMPPAVWAAEAAPVCAIRSWRDLGRRTLAGSWGLAADRKPRTFSISSAGVIPPILDGAADSGLITLVPVTLAKGLEFRAVAVMACDDEIVPLQQRRTTGASANEVAYVGDDLPDLPVLLRVGLAVAVANAVPEVKRAAHFITSHSGGEGAVREVIELIVKAQGKWADASRDAKA